MKTAFFAVLMVTAVPAFAMDLTWNDVRSNSKFQADFPQVNIGPVLISVDQLCIEGDTLRALEPVRQICVANDGAEQPTCTQYQEVILKTPIRFVTEQCVAWDLIGDTTVCAQSVRTERSHALSYIVPVYDASAVTSEHGARRLLFSKSFSIPACQ